MSEPTPNRSRKVTLEELLRLKRHERPGPEHWARFDRELNEKVWLALANPPEEISGHIPAWLGRGLRWMAAGAASAVALIFAWHTQMPVPIAAPVLLPHHETVAAVAPIILPAAAATPVLVASVASTPEAMTTPEKAVFAVSNLTPSTSPAGYNKVPASMSFSAAQTTGERYAADALNTAAFAARWHGSAY